MVCRQNVGEQICKVSRQGVKPRGKDGYEAGYLKVSLSGMDTNHAWQVSIANQKKHQDTDV